MPVTNVAHYCTTCHRYYFNMHVVLLNKAVGGGPVGLPMARPVFDDLSVKDRHTIYWACAPYSLYSWLERLLAFSSAFLTIASVLRVVRGTSTSRTHPLWLLVQPFVRLNLLPTALIRCYYKHVQTKMHVRSVTQTKFHTGRDLQSPRYTLII